MVDRRSYKSDIDKEEIDGEVENQLSSRADVEKSIIRTHTHTCIVTVPGYAVDSAWWLILAHPMPSEYCSGNRKRQRHEQPDSEHLVAEEMR